MTIIGLLPALVSFAISVQAATRTAASCSQPDVAAAVSAAVDGDTVQIPACPSGVGWSAPLTVTKAITLIGAGMGQTVLVDNVTKGTSNCAGVDQMLKINVAADLPWRLSSLTIRGGVTDPYICNIGHVGVSGNSHRFRIDHVEFANMATSGIKVTGNLWGVIDHNTFTGNHKQGIVLFHDRWEGVGAYGDNSWAQPSSFGTEKAIFIEDNVFTDDSAQGAGAFDSFAGGRVVFRKNRASFLGSHGTESGGRFRSIRQYEVYDNVFTAQPGGAATAFFIRGGTGVIFNNTYTGAYTSIAGFANYRDWDPFNPWGQCDGASPWDVNDPVTYASGQHNGASGASNVLTDTTKSFAANQWASGHSVRNLTRGWSGLISANTANTVTSAASVYGTQRFWNAGDSYQIKTAYPCLDQVGRGSGNLISGDAPAPAAWPNQALEPVYQWNNTLNGAANPVVGSQSPRVRAGRDFFNNTPKPGYTPYVYPHPLVSGSQAPPPPPPPPPPTTGTITAASCSQSAVQAAINSAVDGNTVAIPAGECTWTQAVVIDRKILNVKGAGIGATILRDGLPKTGSAFAMLVWNTKDGGLSQLSGITFEGGSTPDPYNKGMINITGSSKQFRMHHCRVHTTQTSGIQTHDVVGVIDSNVFDMEPWKFAIYTFHAGWNGKTFGDGSWADASWLGTDKAIYIENNAFNAPGLSVAHDGWSGSRVVFRKNTLTNSLFANHGTESSGYLRGSRTFEVYDNAFNMPNAVTPSVIGLRSGVGVVFNNTVTTLNTNSSFVTNVTDVTNLRVDQAYTPWGKCDGTSGWDGNQQAGGWPCIDQIGRGQGDLVGRITDPANPTYGAYIPSPVRWPNQLLEPTYAWNNKLNGAVKPMVTARPTNVQENRDFYNAVKPGYTPLAYPHPLVSGSPVPPPPPPPPPADTTAPTVSITSPAGGTTVSGTITISASASDSGGVAAVQFRVDGSNLGSEDTSAPFSAPMNTALFADGSHTLTAVARDNAGNTAVSAPVSITISNATPVPPPPPGAGPMAWWKLDEGSGSAAADSAGSQSAALVNGPVWTAGRFGQGIGFDGIDDHLRTGNFSIGSVSFTLSVWIKRSASGGSDVLSQQAAGFQWGLRASDGLSFYNDSTGWLSTGPSGLADGSWHHAAVVYDGAAVKLYQDGALKNSAAAAFNASALNVPLLIGKWQTNHFAGGLDDVRIYGRALSASEISGLFTGSSGGAFDVNLDGVLSVADVQKAVNQAIGQESCGAGDVNNDGACTVSDVQLIVNEVLGV